MTTLSLKKDPSGRILVNHAHIMQNFSLEISAGVIISHSQLNNNRPNDRIETSDNGEIDQDSEVNVRTRQKKSTRILISDCESQGTEFDVFQVTEKSSAYENSGKYNNGLAKF